MATTGALPAHRGSVEVQVNEICESMTQAKISEILLTELHPFENYPFRVWDDAAMLENVESIKSGGVILPCLARPLVTGGYEVIVGQRTVRACELAGRQSIPTIVQSMDDDTAIITMVNANLPQEKALPSELAWALRMKMEALCHRGKKLEGTDPGTLSVEILMEQTGKSKNQIYRYVHLTELVPDLLDIVDDGRIGFSVAADHLYKLSRTEQAWLLSSMGRYDTTPSVSQALRLKTYSKDGVLSQQLVDDIMAEEKKEPVRVTLTGSKLRRFFPKQYTPKEMEEIIIRLLDDWSKKQVAAG